MKMLLTGDWHLDVVTEGVRRYDEVERAVRFMVDAARRENVDAFVFLGDLSNPNPVRSHRAVALAVSTVEELNSFSIPSIWITGNHDVIEDGTGDHTLMALETSPGALVFGEPCDWAFTSKGGKVLFIALPYTAIAREYDPEEFVAKAAKMNANRPKKMPVVIIGHLEIEGAAQGSESRDLARGRCLTWPVQAITELFPGAHVFGGHYHRGRTYAGMIEVPGAPARLTFGEADHRPEFIIVEV